MIDLERLRVILATFTAYANRITPDLAMTTDYLMTFANPTMTNVDLVIIADEPLTHAFRVYFSDDDCPVVLFAFFDDNDTLTHVLASTDSEPYELIFP